MNNRRTILTVVATALLALCLPVLASAQGSYGRGRNESYYARSLRDAARRVSDRSRDFQRHVDDALDRSRYDDTRREDRINEIARDFRNAANNLRNEIGDGRNINRGSDEAQRLLQSARALTASSRATGSTRALLPIGRRFVKTCALLPTPTAIA